MASAAESLFEQAAAVRERAYAPYSKFRVGAAIEDEAGRIHVGCNVENAAYPNGACAEAGAIAAMIAGGGKRIRKIAVIGGGENIETCTPCGGCRQRISEFADQETEILLKDETGAVRSYSMEELLPAAFALDRND
ncbi:MAG: cytidine deaminase [Parvularculaceae bacterium]